MDVSVMTLGGAAWLNLLNTVYRSQQQPVDLLQNESAVREWLTCNRLIERNEWPLIEPDKNRLIGELVRLREICQSLLRESKRMNEVVPSAVAPLQDLLGRFQLHMVLRLEDGTPMAHYRATDRIDDILYRIGLSAVDTLRSLPLERIRECEHADCILHFADTSKAGKRRWCSMETCGNRHKAAEFYARKKQKS